MNDNESRGEPQARNRDAAADKQALRRAMRSRRRELAADARARASATICEKLWLRTDVGAIAGSDGCSSPLAVYLASPDEIDLSPFIRKMLDAKATVVAPRWNGTTYELAKVKGLGADHVRKGPMGILEPKDADIVPPQTVAIWIVPGLAFTQDGTRLGYGGGWYDRLLAAAEGPKTLIGVAHSFQIVDALPTEPHDVKLSVVLDDSAEGSQPSDNFAIMAP